MDIKEGKVYDDSGDELATAVRVLRYGYHPCILVTIIHNNAKKWFEADEENLVQKIKDWVRCNI